MKNMSIAFFLILIFSSCQSLQFDRFPGKEELEFSESVRGKFEFFNTELSTDTLAIIIERKSFTQTEKGKTQIDFLDSAHVFSVYQGQQFYFQKELNGNWVGFLISNHKKDLILTPFLSANNTSDKNELKNLKKFFSNVEIIEDSTGVPKSNFYIKMNEDELLRYSKKIKKQSVLLKRIK